MGFEYVLGGDLEGILLDFSWIFDDFGGYFGVVGEFSGVIYRLGLVVCETLSRTNLFLHEIGWDK